MKFWDAIKIGLINCGDYDIWRDFLHWYHEKYGMYCWDAVPIGDHIKVWYSKEQYEKAFNLSKTDSCDESCALLAYDCYDQHMVNEELYKEYLIDKEKR